jgi:putative sterol carrier protein
MVMEEIKVKTIFEDEISGRIQGAIQSVAEFGGTIEQGKAALVAINAVSKETGKSLTLVANAARMLADEGETAADVSKHLSTAMALAEKKMMKTEDAGRLLGRTLRGDVGALKDLSPAAARAADKIAKIPDAAKRAKAGMALLNRELRGTPRALDKMNGAIAQADVKLDQMGLGFLSTKALAAGAAAGVAALGAAIFKVGKDSLEAYLKTNAAAKQQMVEFTTATTQLEVALGGLIFQIGNGDVILSKWTTRATKATSIISDLEKWMSKSNITYHSSWMSITRLTTRMDDYSDSMGNAIADIINIIKWLNPFLSVFNWASQALDIAGGAFDYLTEAMSDTDTQAKSTASTVESTVIPGFNILGGVIDNLTTKYRSLADATRKAWVEETSRAAQLKSGQIIVDPLTGVETQREGPAPYAATKGKGKFDIAYKPPKKPTGGGGRRKGPTRAEFQAQLVKDDLAFFEQMEENRLKAQEEGIAARTAATIEEIEETRRRGGIMISLDLERDRRQFEEGQEEFTTATDKMKQDADSARESLMSLGLEGFGSIIGGAFDMIEALALGDIAIKDIGATAADTIGGIMVDQGKALAEHAIKQGAVYSLLGQAYAALATNPLALAAIGAGLMAAGLALKAFAGTGAKRSAASARGADGRAAGAVERMGRDIFNRADDLEGRTMVLMVGDRPMRGYVTDTVNDASRRGMVSTTTRRSAA